MKEEKNPVIEYYKAPHGIFCMLTNSSYVISCYRLNGKEPKVVADVGSRTWLFLKGDKEIKKLEIKNQATTKLVGFKLRQPDLASDKIPDYIKAEEVNEYYDYDDDVYVWEKYNDIRALYDRDTVVEPESFTSIRFETEFLGEINVENMESPKDMKYEVYTDGQWPHKGAKEVDLSTVATWDDIEKLLTPEFALKDRPCKLTSKQAYDIIRFHVNNNIDPAVAKVTSDYDFCFTVKKKIAIRPYEHKWEEKKANGKSYARPRFKSRQVEYIEKEIFEMTSTEESYGGYTPIKGFKGDSLEELAENIKLFLEELMAVINQPVKQCEHCNGTGHIYKKINCDHK